MGGSGFVLRNRITATLLRPTTTGSTRCITVPKRSCLTTHPVHSESPSRRPHSWMRICSMTSSWVVRYQVFFTCGTRLPSTGIQKQLQSTVETATFGSEFSCTKTGSEQIVGMRNTIRYLGVPLEDVSIAFGDNEAVVNASAVPHSKMTKRHNALAYHKTRECIAAGIFRYLHLPGSENPADILSKHWDMPSVWNTLQPLMFWYGDTADLIKDDEKEVSGKEPTPSCSRANRGE